MNSAARGSAVLVVAFFFTSISNYVFNVGIGWFLSTEDFGILGVSLAFLMIFQLITCSGFPQTVMKFLAEDRSDKAKIFKTAMFGNLALGAIIGLIFYLLFKLGFIDLGAKYEPIVLIITLTLIIASIGIVAQYGLQGFFKFNESALIQVIATAIKLIFGIGLV